MIAKSFTSNVFYLGQLVVLFVLISTLPYCDPLVALTDLGSIYNVIETSAFSIVKVQKFNYESRHG